LVALILIISIGTVLGISFVGVTKLRQSKSKLREKEAEIESLKKQKSEITEDDIILSKEKHFCLVHKGPVEGYSFICPVCNAYYCLKCVEALKTLENQCWSCENPLDPNIPIKDFKEDGDLSVEETEGEGSFDPKKLLNKDTKFCLECGAHNKKALTVCIKCGKNFDGNLNWNYRKSK